VRSICPRSSSWRGDRVAGAGLGGDDGHAGRQVAQRVGGGLLRGDHDDAVDAAVAQALQGALDRLARERAQRDDDDEVARVVGGALDPEDRGGGAVERGVEGDHAQRPRQAGHQRAGGGVGAVVELPHRRQDAIARLRAHGGGVVQDARHRLVGHARELGDVRHDR
jgi:hypothetical protein